MTVHQGKVHNYLRMTLECTEDGTVRVGMIDYMDGILAAFDKADPKGCEIKTINSPEDLNKVDEEC